MNSKLLALIIASLTMATLLLANCSSSPDSGRTLPAATQSRPRSTSPTAIPTWTEEPVTPTPTGTPTATPTPVVYLIQRGDTLVDIAKRFGVSASRIQEANGITDPRLLQIGQQLIIPMPELNGPSATPTATPLPVHVRAVSQARTTTGDVVIVGEVTNESAQAVEEVNILIELLDEHGNVIASTEAYAMRDTIEVEGTAPFGAVLSASSRATEARARVIRAMPEHPQRATYHDLAVAEVSGRQVYDRTFLIMGKIRNYGDLPATDIFVVATVYGSDGRVIGVKREPVSGTLPPGERTLFRTTLVPIAWPVASYRIAVEGRLPVNLQTATPQPSPASQ